MIKQIVYLAIFICLIGITRGYTQENTTPVMTEEQIQQMKEVQQKVEKAQKEAEKAEKAQKKEAKEAKEAKRLKDDIRSTKRSIDRDGNRIDSLKEKLEKDGAKGKLSPKDIENLNGKIQRLEARIAKDEARLKKLEKKK